MYKQSIQQNKKIIQGNRINKKKKISFLRLFSFITIISILFFIIYKICFFAYEKINNYFSNKNNSNIYKSEILTKRNNKNLEIKKIEDSEIISYISKHIELPNEEIKMMAKVTDPETLKTQSVIYKDIKKDDYILVYPNLAIIYDARADKITKMLTLNTD